MNLATSTLASLGVLALGSLAVITARSSSAPAAPTSTAAPAREFSRLWPNGWRPTPNGASTNATTGRTRTWATGWGSRSRSIHDSSGYSIRQTQDWTGNRAVSVSGPAGRTRTRFTGADGSTSHIRSYGNQWAMKDDSGSISAGRTNPNTGVSRFRTQDMNGNVSGWFGLPGGGTVQRF